MRGLAEVCVLIKDKACVHIMRNWEGRMTSGNEGRKTSDFVIPKCNLLGKNTLPGVLNNSKANNVPGINIGSIFSPVVCTRLQ